MCSTPFGIEARRTFPLELWQPPEDRVLNAFRHRGKEDSRGSATETHSSWPSAQRLSASRQGGRWPARASSPVDRRCSTPFGIEARRTAKWAGFGAAAFGCSTPFGIEARRTRVRRPGGPSPANPSAQRLSASRQGGPTAAPRADSGLACSTPFGIEARRTR